MQNRYVVDICDAYTFANCFVVHTVLRSKYVRYSVPSTYIQMLQQVLHLACGLVGTHTDTGQITSILDKASQFLF